MTEVELTQRQREIVERLDRGMKAREIGEELGITRNAVYQQITRLRERGVIADERRFPEDESPRFEDRLRAFIASSRQRLDEIDVEEQQAHEVLANLQQERQQITASIDQLMSITATDSVKA